MCLVLEARTVLSTILHSIGFSKKGWIIPLPPPLKKYNRRAGAVFTNTDLAQH